MAPRQARATAPSIVSVAGRSVLPPATVQRVAGEVCAREKRSAVLSFTFLGRDRMRLMNREHMAHDWPTDVISFALHGPGRALAGDVYISPWVAAREARAAGVSLREELIRLVIHGTLHVLGYDHPDGATRQRSPMWRRQERYVAELA